MNYKDLGFSGLLQKLILAPPTIDTTINSISNLGLMLNPASDIVFSSTDEDTAAWATGNIYFSDGSISGQIAAGDTGTMTGVTFIYYDRNKPGALQYTTSHTNATGTTKFLVAIAEPGAEGKDCKIVPIIGSGLSVTDITADQITAGAITTDLLTISAKSFVSTIVWTATDANTAAWAEGTITTADGTVYTIAAGNTGNIEALTYIYLDIDESEEALQTTTTAATAVGNNKISVAIVQKGATGAKCVIDVLNSYGTTIDGDRITTGKIQSSDEKTYFDLDNDVLIVNDGTDDRLLLGYQDGGF